MTSPAFDRNFDAAVGEAAQVSPLVRRVLCGNRGPYTFTGTSSFIVGRGRVAIIDPGPNDEAHLAALLHAVRGETVSHILITHSHDDHSPLAARLNQETGAHIVGHDGLTSFKPDEAMTHGDVLTGDGWTLEALHTPGHMANHLCFALREESGLFTGDHVMSWSTSVVIPPDGHMGDYMASLRLLLAREEGQYLPAHGPSRRDPRPYVQSLIAHREKREAEILARIRAGDKTISEIVQAIYTGLAPSLHAAAAQSTHAHVAHLLEQGLIDRQLP